MYGIDQGRIRRRFGRWLFRCWRTCMHSAGCLFLQDGLDDGPYVRRSIMLTLPLMRVAARKDKKRFADGNFQDRKLS